VNGRSVVLKEIVGKEILKNIRSREKTNYPSQRGYKKFLKNENPPHPCKSLF